MNLRYASGKPARLTAGSEGMVSKEDGGAPVARSASERVHTELLQLNTSERVD